MFSPNKELLKLDKELDKSFMKFYYTFIVNAFNIFYSNCNLNLRIIFDNIPENKAECKMFKELLIKKIRNNKYHFKNQNYISRVFIEKDKIEEVDSKKHIILKCIDVIVGCIDFVLNEGIITTVRGRAKNEVARFIIKNIHELKENFILTKTTRPTAGFEAWNLKYSHFVYRKKEPPTLLLKSSTQRVAIR